jgi:hypothetical protein
MKRHTCDRCGKRIAIFVNQTETFGYLKLEVLKPDEGIVITFNQAPVQATELCGTCVRALLFWLLQSKDSP